MKLIEATDNIPSSTKNVKLYCPNKLGIPWKITFLVSNDSQVGINA